MTTESTCERMSDFNPLGPPILGEEKKRRGASPLCTPRRSLPRRRESREGWPSLLILQSLVNKKRGEPRDALRHRAASRCTAETLPLPRWERIGEGEARLSSPFSREGKGAMHSHGPLKQQARSRSLQLFLQQFLDLRRESRESLLPVADDPESSLSEDVGLGVLVDGDDGL